MRRRKARRVGRVSKCAAKVVILGVVKGFGG